ncbi:hypothetical protein ERO13_A11G016950v2 [Gossypium hirsutum]|nr:hypothetical protein ERO13_A11G016950v2 [Gossypium hirsutum]
MSTNLCLMFVKSHDCCKRPSMWLQKTQRSLSLLLDKRVGFSQYFQLRSFSVFTMHSSYTQLPCHPRGYIFVSWRELRFLNPKVMQ